MSLPEHICKEVAAVLLANIIALSETEEWQAQFKDWKTKKENGDKSSESEENQ